jgi:hypothetical protein
MESSDTDIYKMLDVSLVGLRLFLHFRSYFYYFLNQINQSAESSFSPFAERDFNPKPLAAEPFREQTEEGSDGNDYENDYDDDFEPEPPAPTEAKRTAPNDQAKTVEEIMQRWYTTNREETKVSLEKDELLSSSPFERNSSRELLRNDEEKETELSKQ